MGGKMQKMAKRERAAVEEGQRFKDSLAVVITFWLDMGNTPEKRVAMVEKMLEILFTTHPEYESLFHHRSAFPNMINSMFNTLVNLLATSKLEEAVQKIEETGKRHHKYGVPASAFGHWLASFEKAVQEFFPDKFTPRVQFCFSAALNFVASKMIEAAELQDCEVASSVGSYEPKYPEGYFDDLDVDDWSSFSSNEICLQYLHLHLVTFLSSEMSLLLREVLEYRKAPTCEKYKEIFRTYISEDGPIAANLNDVLREQITKRFEVEGSVSTVFDPAVREIGSLIRRNTYLWADFRDSTLWQEMLSNIAFHKKHEKKLRQQAEHSVHRAKTEHSVHRASTVPILR